MRWRDDFGGGQYIKLPIGNEIRVTINEIKKVDKTQFNFKKKTGENCGFCYEFITDKGILTVGAWALAIALKNVEADVGDTVNIKHFGKGDYKVEKIEKEIDLEDEKQVPF